MNIPNISATYPPATRTIINTIDNKGIELVKNKIKELFKFDKITNGDFTYITNLRQINEIKKSLIVSIRSEDMFSFFESYYKLPYFLQREIYFTLLNAFLKFEQKDLLKKERKEA